MRFFGGIFAASLLALAVVILTLPEPPAPGLVGAEPSAWERGGGRHALSPVPAWIEPPADWRVLSSEELSAWDDTGRAIVGGLSGIVLATSDTNSIATASGIAILIDGGAGNAAAMDLLQAQGPSLAAVQLVATNTPRPVSFAGFNGAELQGRVTVPGRLGSRTAEGHLAVIDVDGRSLIATSIIKPEGTARAHIQTMLNSISGF